MSAHNSHRVYSVVFRILLTFIGLCGAAWFLLPVFSFRIFNIGNATGIVASLFIALLGLFLPSVLSIFKRLFSHKSGKVFLCVISGFLFVAIVIVLAAAICIVSAMITDVPNSDDGDTEISVVVVLGCRVIGENPSLMLSERIDAAFYYLTEHDDAVCVLSGGQGADEGISEAECMYRCLTAMGISPERLLREDRSTSTRENILYSKDVIESAYGEGSFSDIAVVTNEFHGYRAVHISYEAGVSASFIPAKTAWWLFPTYFVREIYAVVYEWVR